MRLIVINFFKCLTALKIITTYKPCEPVSKSISSWVLTVSLWEVEHVVCCNIGSEYAKGWESRRRRRRIFFPFSWKHWIERNGGSERGSIEKGWGIHAKIAKVWEINQMSYWPLHILTWRRTEFQPCVQESILERNLLWCHVAQCNSRGAWSSEKMGRTRFSTGCCIFCTEGVAANPGPPCIASARF